MASTPAGLTDDPVPELGRRYGSIKPILTPGGGKGGDPPGVLDKGVGGGGGARVTEKNVG
jgi:hypothetical protein